MTSPTRTTSRAARLRTPLLMALAVATLIGASGCAPLVVGGAVAGGTLLAVDRRTSGAQLEDEGIELRSASRLRAALASSAHVNLTSYNRQVLLTGEVATEKDKFVAEQVVRQTDNVRSVLNELGVMPASSIAQRSADAVITGRVKAALLDTKDVQASAFKVVTERSVVYLLGRVSAAEAARATEVVRNVAPVQKVVRALEILTDDELRALSGQVRVQVPLSEPTAAPAKTD